MTMPERPKPPEGYETWLDYAVDHVAGWRIGEEVETPEKLAREELKELRERVKDLEDMLRIAEGCMERIL
jgi:predicted thioesterase